MPAAQPTAASTNAQARGRKAYPAGMRYVVLAMLVMIGASLASALIFMVKGRDDPKRMAKALTVRIALSVGLFVMLMAGYYFGLIPGRL